MIRFEITQSGGNYESFRNYEIVQRWFIYKNKQATSFCTITFCQKALAKRTQVDASQRKFEKNTTCLRTCDGWPNGFASRLASLRSRRKSYISRMYSWRSTCVNLHLMAKRGKKVNASQRSRWVVKRNTNRTQVKNLRWLASTCEFVCIVLNSSEVVSK